MHGKRRPYPTIAVALIWFGFSLIHPPHSLAKESGKITLNLENESPEIAFKVISVASGLNIVLTKAARNSERVTLQLTDIHWKTALDTLLSLLNLKAKQKGNVMLVMAMDELPKETFANVSADELKPKKKNVKKSIEYEPKKITLKKYRLRYSNPSKLKGIISQHMKGSKTEISIDQRNNALIVAATEGDHSKINELITLVDTRTAEVILSVRVIESKEDFSKITGLGKNSGITIHTSAKKTAPQSSEIKISPNQGMISFSGNNIGLLKNYNAELMALERQGKLQTGTEQKITTRSGLPAHLNFSTKQVYMVTKTNSQGKSVPERIALDIPRTLTITPKALPDGSVDLKVSVSNSSAIPTEAGELAEIEANTLSTTISAKSGETVAIGGFSKNQSTEAAQSGVPGLKKVPTAGVLFRTPSGEDQNKREHTILITPTIKFFSD